MVMMIGNKSRIPNVKNIPKTTHSKLFINHSNVSQSNKYKIYYKILNTNQRYAIKRKVHINMEIHLKYGKLTFFILMVNHFF